MSRDSALRQRRPELARERKANERPERALTQASQPKAPLAALRQIRQDRLAHARLAELGVFDRARAIEACMHNSAQPHVTTIELFNGVPFQIDLREAVSKTLYMFAAYEENLTAFFIRALKPGMVFVDAGAHYGYFSVLASGLVGASGRVIAFEPIEETARRLELNAQRHANIEVRRQAVWDECGELEMNRLPPEHSAFNSVAMPRLAPAIRLRSTKVKVQAITLDSAFEGAEKQPTAIKIDVESAELQVLAGMKRLLSQVRPIVTVEVGDYAHLQDAGVPGSRSILQALIDADYLLFDSENGRLSRHVLRDAGSYKYDNIIAIAREQRGEKAS